MDTRNYWEDNGHSVKYDNYNSNEDFGPGTNDRLNFAVQSEDEAEYPPGAYLKKGKQDPMSHRIIEKRRRDRMNNCLADLSRLIPPEYLKKGRGRVEKTEIIEMAIRHITYLQDRANGLYQTPIILHMHSDHVASVVNSDRIKIAMVTVHFTPSKYHNIIKEGLQKLMLPSLKGANVMGSLPAIDVPSSRGNVLAAERRSGQEFRAGYQEAADEVVRFMSEVQGFTPRDAQCTQLASHLQRHCDAICKGEVVVREQPHSRGGSSSEATSSSGSSRYQMKGVITQAPPPPPFAEPYEQDRAQEPSYPMDCNMGTDLSVSAASLEGDTREEVQPLPLDARRPREPTLRAVRKADHAEEYLHSYKFKNCIERRFSRSQDEAADELARGQTNGHGHGKTFIKRRRAVKPTPATSTSGSGSGSTEEARDTSPQDTSSESPHPHPHYDKPTPAQYVPVFALNALGKYYIPLSVDYGCLAKYLSAYDAIDSRSMQMSAPLHPVTIHVNFQPCVKYHVKREPNERDWRPA